MTVDTDYQLNWNKENVPQKFKDEKPAKCRKPPGNRVVLGEVTQFINAGMRRMRIDENDHAVEDVNKWQQIAASLRCDPEENDETLMRELLGLCEWSEENEKSDDSVYNAETSDGSEDEDDEAFMAYIRNQRVQKIELTTTRRNSSTATLKGLNFSKLHIEPHSEQKKPVRCLGNSRNVVKKKSSNTRCCDSSNSFNRMDTIEKAFFGMTSDDNDAVTPPSSRQPFTVLKSSSVSSDIWADIQFTL